MCMTIILQNALDTLNTLITDMEDNSLIFKASYNNVGTYYYVFTRILTSLEPLKTCHLSSVA